MKSLQSLITDTLLTDFFLNARLQLNDIEYALPDKAWVSDELWFKSFESWLFDNGLQKWRETWDCNKFSATFYLFAKICHSHTMDGYAAQGLPTVQGIAVGMMCYSICGDPKEGHSINVVIANDGAVYTFEPQTGKYVELTQQERESCWFVMM